MRNPGFIAAIPGMLVTLFLTLGCEGQPVAPTTPATTPQLETPKTPPPQTVSPVLTAAPSPTRAPTPSPAPRPAEFVVNNITLEPAAVEPGQSSTVTAKIFNTGELAGTYTARLTIGGKETDRKDVSIVPNDIASVTFEMNESVPGRYEVAIGQGKAELTVWEMSRYLLRRDNGTLSTSTSMREPRGQWVKFSPPTAPFRIQKIFVMGFRSNFDSAQNATHTIKIWDKNFQKELFSKEYPDAKFATTRSLAEYRLDPEIIVADDFIVDFISHAVAAAEKGKPPTKQIYVYLDYTVATNEYSGVSWLGTDDKKWKEDLPQRKPEASRFNWMIQVQGTGRKQPGVTVDGSQEPPTIPSPKPVSTPKPTSAPPAVAPTLSLTDISNNLKETLVRIKTNRGTGSGMIISADGYILTANHVITKTTEIKVILPDGKEVEAKASGRDEIRDVALLRIKGDNLKTVSFGKSEDVRVGEEVVAIGFPLDLKGSPTPSKGIISGIRKTEETGPIYIQTDASVSPGHSGGALVNKKGEIIGVITWKLVGNAVEGIAFATAIQEVVAVLNRLKAGEFIAAPYSPAEAVKKFESRDYLYSFSYPASWKIVNDREDQLIIVSSDNTAAIKIYVFTKGEVVPLGEALDLATEKLKKEDPSLKLTSDKKLVNRGIAGIEVNYEKSQPVLHSGTLFFTQAVAGAGGRSTYMAYFVEGYILDSSLKKHTRNIEAFFSNFVIRQ